MPDEDGLDGDDALELEADDLLFASAELEELLVLLLELLELLDDVLLDDEGDVLAPLRMVIGLMLVISKSLKDD